jgi:hypothetical protein
MTNSGGSLHSAIRGARLPSDKIIKFDGCYRPR